MENICSPLTTDCEMTLRMATFCTMDIRNMNTSTSNPLPMFRKEDDVVDVSPSDQDIKIRNKPNEVRPTQVELQYIIQSNLQILKEAVFKQCIRAMQKSRNYQIIKNCHPWNWDIRIHPWLSNCGEWHAPNCFSRYCQRVHTRERWYPQWTAGFLSGRLV